MHQHKHSPLLSKGDIVVLCLCGAVIISTILLFFR